MTQVLHITAHIGGGIGKALSGLVEQSIISNSEFRHTILLLEKPIKSQFVDKIRRIGGKVVVCPATDELEKLILYSDIVQLEWLNHPTIIKYLCSISQFPIRFLVWSHNNGLHNIPKSKGKLPPIIPKNLIKQSDIFLFTNECSFQNKEVIEIKDKLGVVYSSGGFDGFPDPNSKNTFTSFSCDNIKVGYFGSFDKLHPEFVKYISAINIKSMNINSTNSTNNFKVKMIGEYSTYIRRQLTHRCNEIGKPNLLQFTGYIEKQEDLIKELSKINVLAYILNPKHYGTTENALLECMSMGIVPIVLNNPAESYLVDNGKTGFVVHSPKEFADIIKYLSENPDERQRIGINAAKTVRERFSAEKTESYLNEYYRKLMQMEKKNINFKEILSDGS